ncbi:hypothetical protein [Oribacterium sp. WCC10]|uniref:hypothetical protein n=1 Tax=Oribacterium sp. WCC10 TaxID=1855343 RepID=UPI0008E3BAD0|nr:hypothetical protein [Oribacterium sp. WCC10]SFG29888.1 hypothetical protein SAMN05216356_10538 [Oribacterium sp. WCC10]
MNGECIYRKINSKDGFSLTETLTTLLIMSLVGIMITTGMATAVKAYRQVTEYADAESLLSNTIVLLTDELSYADTQKTIQASGNTATFFLIDDREVRISFDEEKGICKSYKKTDGTYTSPEPLVSYQNNEFITNWNVSYNSTYNYFEIEKLWVENKKNERIIGINDNTNPDDDIVIKIQVING